MSNLHQKSPPLRSLCQAHVAVGQNLPILVYFSGDWDVHWEYGLLDPSPCEATGILMGFEPCEHGTLHLRYLLDLTLAVARDQITRSDKIHERGGDRRAGMILSKHLFDQTGVLNLGGFTTA